MFFLYFIGQLYGIEKFWAFLKYYKHADKLSVDPKLKEHLDKFNTIEDFRVVEPQINEVAVTGNRRQRSISASESAVPLSSSFTRSEFSTSRSEQNRKR